MDAAIKQLSELKIVLAEKIKVCNLTVCFAVPSAKSLIFALKDLYCDCLQATVGSNGNAVASREAFRAQVVRLCGHKTCILSCYWPLINRVRLHLCSQGTAM